MSELNKQCAACKVQVKDWPGDDPSCNFTNGTFANVGWNCATTRMVRKLATSDYSGITGSVHNGGDQNYITINTGDIEVAKWSDEDGWETPNPVCLWVGWYKNRGSTEGMYLMFENLPPRPPTEEECLKIVEHYKT